MILYPLHRLKPGPREEIENALAKLENIIGGHVVDLAKICDDDGNLLEKLAVVVTELVMAHQWADRWEMTVAMNPGTFDEKSSRVEFDMTEAGE